MRKTISLFAAGFSTLSVAQAQDTEPFDLGTLVLEGERAERSLEDTFVGVSIISEDRIKDAPGSAHINDVIVSTPNVFVEGKSEVPSIRGIQGGGPGGTVSASLTSALPRLAFVLDGVTRPVVLPNSSGASLWDTRQIEVLRGPQSLLRGRSAIAGAIIVETNDPTFTPEAALQFGVAVDDFGGPEYTLNGMISGPLSENVAGRLTFELADGADARTVLNEPAAPILDYDNVRIRGKLLGEFETAAGLLTLDFLAEHQQGQTPQTRNSVQTPVVTGRPLEDRILDGALAGPLGIPARTFDTETNVLSLDAGLDLGVGTLRGVFSFVDDEFVSIPEQTYPFPFDVSERILTQEILYEFGPSDRVRAGQFGGLVGLTFEQRDQRTDLQGLLAFSSDSESDSRSAFADLRYGLTDQLTIFGGARVLDFNGRFDQSSTVATPGGVVSGTQNFEINETEFLPALGLAYYFDEDIVLSGSVRTGYNPGGSSVNIFTGQPFTYDSERVATAEVNFRQSFPEFGFRYGVTAFHNWHEDPQLYAELVPGNRASLQVINQNKGRSYGLEFDADWQATDRLNLNGAIGLLKTEITEASAFNPALEGNSFGQDPNVTLSLGALYEINDIWSVDGRATYRGSHFNDFNEVDEIGDYWIVDIGATAQFRNFEMRGYVTNLFDETGVTRLVGGGTFADVTEPMTVGFDVTARW
ncbi:TonB-dependent receptor [Yoonia sp. R2-816]|uniref:TonB-dependent receptor n=1 Tax=Yoonia sp. R2-816 TaxID=3342638 RepID=UPI0037284E7E